MRVLAVVLCLAAATYARMAYKFSDGYLDILGAEPAENFDCTGRPYGYYADVASGCQVFHVCVPLEGEDGETVSVAHYSFFCGNQTIFNQESLTCAHTQESLPCEEAESMYESSNANFGQIPDGQDNAI